MSDEQLQLFDVPERLAHRRREFASLGHATLRHDHAVLLIMTALIVASIVFAFGVERGKRLAHTELPAPVSAVEAPTTPKLVQKPSKLASEASGFAVQVVSCTQAKFAQQALQQLQRQGEKAFLLQQQGRTMLLVGPFSTKANAAGKLSTLRQRYRDCFIRTL